MRKTRRFATPILVTSVLLMVSSQACGITLDWTVRTQRFTTRDVVSVEFLVKGVKNQREVVDMTLRFHTRDSQSNSFFEVDDYSLRPTKSWQLKGVNVDEVWLTKVSVQLKNEDSPLECRRPTENWVWRSTRSADQRKVVVVLENLGTSCRVSIGSDEAPAAGAALEPTVQSPVTPVPSAEPVAQPDAPGTRPIRFLDAACRLVTGKILYLQPNGHAYGSVESRPGGGVRIPETVKRVQIDGYSETATTVSADETLRFPARNEQPIKFDWAVKEVKLRLQKTTPCPTCPKPGIGPSTCQTTLDAKELERGKAIPLGPDTIEPLVIFLDNAYQQSHKIVGCDPDIPGIKIQDSRLRIESVALLLQELGGRSTINILIEKQDPELDPKTIQVIDERPGRGAVQNATVSWGERDKDKVKCNSKGTCVIPRLPTSIWGAGLRFEAPGFKPAFLNYQPSTDRILLSPMKRTVQVCLTGTARPPSWIVVQGLAAPLSFRTGEWCASPSVDADTELKDLNVALQQPDQKEWKLVKPKAGGYPVTTSGDVARVEIQVALRCAPKEYAYRIQEARLCDRSVPFPDATRLEARSTEGGAATGLNVSSLSGTFQTDSCHDRPALVLPRDTRSPYVAGAPVPASASSTDSSLVFDLGSSLTPRPIVVWVRLSNDVFSDWDRIIGHVADMVKGWEPAAMGNLRVLFSIGDHHDFLWKSRPGDTDPQRASAGIRQAFRQARAPSMATTVDPDSDFHDAKAVFQELGRPAAGGRKGLFIYVVPADSSLGRGLANLGSVMPAADFDVILFELGHQEARESVCAPMLSSAEGLRDVRHRFLDAAVWNELPAFGKEVYCNEFINGGAQR